MRLIYNCPVCDSKGFNFLSQVWKNYYQYNLDEFYLSDSEWFVECEQCGCIRVLPLIDYQEDFTKYGEAYYDQRDHDVSLDAHVLHHYEQFQKYNYDNIHQFIKENLPASEYPNWLDVGACGCSTTFNDYNFTALEPDSRVVEAGKRIFKSQNIFCSTLERFETKEIYDGILFNNSFYCISTPHETLSKAYNLLKDSGHLIITFSTYFHDAKINRYDGKYSCIEDVMPGITVVVHYNEFALNFLASRFGFNLVSSAIIPAYGLKTMRVYNFKKEEKQPSSLLKLNKRLLSQEDHLLEKSKDYQQSKIEECFKSFEYDTKETLESINHGRTILVGSIMVLNDLLDYHPLDKIAGFITYPEIYSDCSFRGIQFIDHDYLRKSFKKYFMPKHNLVICSYKYQEKIIDFIRSTFSSSANIFCPTRISGMESIFFKFNGQSRPSKSFTLQKIE